MLKLKSKAIRKIFISTLSLFILLVCYSIPNLEQGYTLRTNLEIENATGLYTNNLYLLNEDGYLVKSKILLDSNDLSEKIKKIISELTIQDSNNLPTGLFPYIPKGTEVLNVLCGEKQVTVDFSSEFLNMKVNKEKQIISGIVYSILDLDEVEEVILLVEGEVLKEYLEQSKDWVYEEENLHEKLEVFRGYFKEKGVKPKVTMWAIRAAVTGRTRGADMTATLAILGKDKVEKRIKAAIK